MERGRLAAAWTLGAAGYAIGLIVSNASDLPSGPVIVWTLVAVSLAWYAITSARQAKATRPQDSIR
jgi:zinc/manganese transport system permease protein